MEGPRPMKTLPLQAFAFFASPPLRSLRFPLAPPLPLSLRSGAAGCRTSQVPSPSLPLPVRFPGGCGFRPRPFPFTSAPAGRTATCHLSLFTCHSRRRRVPFAFFASTPLRSLRFPLAPPLRPPCAENFFQSLENARKFFPIIGKTGPVFQPLETFFPIIGKLRRSFPTIGKKFSNHWKIRPFPPGHKIVQNPSPFPILHSAFCIVHSLK